MTEEEAKTKWCCGPLQVTSAIMVASCLANGVTQEELDRTFPKRGRCIGSDCMAWRWSLHASGEIPPGYCGLVGNPRDR